MIAFYIRKTPFEVVVPPHYNANEFYYAEVPEEQPDSVDEECYDSDNDENVEVYDEVEYIDEDMLLEGVETDEGNNNSVPADVQQIEALPYVHDDNILPHNYAPYYDTWPWRHSR